MTEETGLPRAAAERRLELVKLVVFVPVEHADAVRLAVAAAGAGRIGDYDHCAFATPGTGYFRPLAKARPFFGEVGVVEKVEELRLETVCAVDLLPGVLRALRDSHPYEEIAYDLIPLLNPRYAPLVPRKGPPQTD